MRKITALILAAIMVALCFSVATVASAEDTNLLAGMTYTVGGTAGVKDPGTAGADSSPVSLLTDGATRTPEEMNSTGAPVSGKTLEYTGTGKDVSFTFEFDSAVTIATVVADGARTWDVAANNSGEAAPNRAFAFSKIEVSTDGINFTEVTFTTSKVVIAGSQQYGTTEPLDQFWTVTATLDTAAENVSALRVTATNIREGDGSAGYIIQLDELEAYASAGATEETSAPVEETSAPVEETSAPVEETTTEETTVEETTTEETTVDETTEVEVPVADITYTVEFVEQEDGTYLLTIAAPAGTASGSLFFALGEDLSIVADSATQLYAMANFNGEYEDAGVAGLYVNFMGMQAFANDTALYSFVVELAEGATLEADDFIIYAYELSDESDIVSTLEDGTCEIIVPVVEEETTVEETTEETTTEETTAETTVETTVEETTEETSENGENGAPDTGDAGIAVFAVLALVSAAAVVVIKKRA